MFSAVIVTVPPSGMASRAFTIRFTSAISNSLTSTLTGQMSAEIATLSRTLGPRPLVSDRPERLQLLRKLGRRGAEPLAAGEREQLAREGGTALGRDLDRFGRARGLGIVLGEPLECLDVPAHDHQQVVEIVRDAAGQLPERVHLLRFGKLLLHLLEFHLRFAPLGVVACDLGEAHQRAVLVDRVDHHACPEERAVLAHAPAFRRIASMLRRRREGARRHTRCPLGVGIKAREMLADDLARRIALDALGAVVPSGDDAVRVEHIERIVCHAADQQAELPFAFAQGFLRPALLGDVTGDLGETQEFAIVAAERVDHDGSEEAGAVLAHPPAVRLRSVPRASPSPASGPACRRHGRRRYKSS